jgi:predicted CxxxxCH...CXXCH cytochrome family protein
MTFVNTSAYASDMELSDFSLWSYIRNNDGDASDQVRYEIGYVTGGAFTALGGQTQTGPADRATIAYSVPGVIGTAPSGSVLAIRAISVTATTGDRIYMGTADDTNGSVRFMVTETAVASCTPTTGPIVVNGGSLNGNPVDLTSITTENGATNLVYTVSDGSAAPPFTTYTENFVTGDNFGSWVNSNDDASSSAFWATLDGQTPSGTNTVGPTVDQSGSGFFAYTEATGATYPFNSWLVSPSIDNANYATSLDFWWNKNHNGTTYCELYVDASSDDGATWDNLAIWNPTPPEFESADGTDWTQASIDLSGIAPTGAQDNIKVRFRTISGGFECDTAVDTVTIDGTPRGTTYFTGNAAQSVTADTTGWPAGSLTLTVNGDDDCVPPGALTDNNTFTFSACNPTGEILWNGTTTANGDFAGASMVNSTSNISGNVEYQITSVGAGTVSQITPWTNVYDGGAGGPVTVPNAFDIVSASSGKMLFVYLAPEGGNQTTMTATYGGQPMNLAGSVVSGNPNPSFVFWLNASDLDGRTGNDLDITADAGWNQLKIGYTLVDGVDQAAPISDFQGLVSTTAGSGWYTIPALNVAAGELVITGNNHQRPTDDHAWTFNPAEFNYEWNSTGTNNGAFGATRNNTNANAALTIGWNQVSTQGGSKTFYSLAIKAGAGAGATVIPWNTDPLSPTPSASLSNGDYNIYARALDATCGSYVYGDPAVSNATADGTAKTITWSSCAESNTVNAPTFLPSATPILGDVTVNATGDAGAGTITVSWSENGGGSWSSWVATGSTYSPTTCTATDVIFRARGTASCGGDLITEGSPVAFDTIETATVTVANPGAITVATPITVTLGGSGGDTPQWSADGGSNWYASGVDYTPLSCNSGAVIFTARANGSCGVISGETDPVNTTYDTTVTGSITVQAAQSLNGSPIDLTSIVDLTDMDTSTLTYSVDVTSGSPSSQTDDFSAATLGAAGRPTFGNWAGVNGSDATNGWMASTGGTASAGTGPSAGNGGQYVVLESSPTSAAPSTATMGNGSNGTYDNATTDDYMYVDRNNPATANGTITEISAYIQTDTGGTIKFYTCAPSDAGGGDTDCLVTAQTGWLTPTVAPGNVETWTGLSLTVNNGDILGFVGDGNGITIGRKASGTQYQYVNGAGPRPTDGVSDLYQDSGTNTQGLMVEATYSYGGGGDADATDGVNVTSGSTQYLESNVINASAQALSLTFDYNMNVGDNADAVLDVEAYNGSAWVDATGGNVNTGSTGDVWASSGAIDLSSYNNADFQVRIRYDVGTGSTSLNDVAVDNMVITGTPTVSTNNYTYAQAQSVDTSSWTAGAIPLTVDGDDTCGGARADGPTDFDWIDCTDTEIVTAVNPGVLGGSTQITATLDGTGGSSPMVRWSIDGGAFTAWVASGSSLNPPASSTGNIVIEASATGSCGGTIYAAAQVNTTYDTTCSDPGAAVTLGAIGQPITGTVSGISATSNRAQAVQVSLDNSSWVATGTLNYTPPAQSTGSQDFYAQSTDNCGVTISDTFSRTFDSRTNNLVVLPASRSQQGLNGVTITMPYLGDKDGNATFRYQYQENLGGYTAWSAPVTDADGVSPKTFSLSGLALDALVDINVQYIDAGIDHNGNLDPQDLQIQLVGWVDNDLLHNSLRFACDKIGYATQLTCEGAGGVWDEETKWTGGWGTTTGEYGPIMCATCHTKNATNIKKIQSAIPGSFPGSADTVTFTTTTDGSSDFGDDLGGHGTSSKVCETCHSVTNYHRYDTSGQGALDHQNQADCINCHTHNTGFRASCDSCHASPPIDAGGLDTTSNSGTGTGSATAGAHDYHVNTLGLIDCNACHNGWEAAGEMPMADDSGDINIGFNAFGSTAGTYTGQAGVSYNGSGGSGGLNCNNTYCHGGTISGSAPVWSGSVSCGDCHGDDAASASTLPSGTSHNTHANAQGLACNECHGAHALGDGHVDGDVNWSVGGLPGSSPTYSGSATGTAGNRAPSGSYGTCSNISCHNNVVTPVWDGSANCTTCHATPPATNAHATHYTAKGWSGDASCDNCHPDNTAGHSDVTDSSIEVDAGLGWNGTTCSITSTGCHNGNTTPGWTTSGIACIDCHTVGGTNSATVANPVSGLHDMSTGGVEKHDNNITGGCEACHTKTSIGGHWDGTASAATPNFTSAQVGITAMTGGSYTDAGGTGTSRGTCTTTCHSDGNAWSRLWSTAADSAATAATSARCDVCHGQWDTWVTGTTHYKAGGTNNKVNNRGSGHDGTPDCDNCHAYESVGGNHDTATHRITMNSNGTSYARSGANAGCTQCHGGGANASYNFPNSVFTANEVSGTAIPMPACNSCHDTGSGGAPIVLIGTSSHLATTTGGGDQICESCHAGHADGTTGTNDIEVDTTPATYNNKYASHGGGAIKLGGTATSSYNPTNEAEFCWGCHEAQGTDISEWGTNTGGTYNYGSVTINDLNWTTTSWSSAVFSYKDGALDTPPGGQASASIHATGGTPGTQSENLDLVQCSACHNVHTGAAPFLRAAWRPSGYDEDGAPRSGADGSGVTYPQDDYGRVPRGVGSYATLGGWQIDQNNNNPNSAAYTYTTQDALCATCHTQAAIQSAAPLHGNSVKGFNTGLATNILRVGATNAGGAGNTPRGGGDTALSDENNTANNANPNMGYWTPSNPACELRGWGLRESDDPRDGMAPTILTDWNCKDGTNKPNEARYAYDVWDRGISALPDLTQDLSTIDTNFHAFTCSKCHNPHASRLPRLMITNCLDVVVNTWDDTLNPSADTTGSWWVNNTTNNNPAGIDQLAYVSSAQNCHRRSTVEEGWNDVTPW